MRASRHATVALVAGLALGACSVADDPAPGTSAPTTVELTIFAAASLGAALDAAADAYASATPGTSMTIATGSSAALATQIAQGAPADVFLAADTASPQRLIDAGLADGTAVPFAANGLVVITPLDDPAGIETPFDLATPGVRVIAAGDDVPITRYAMELIERLGADPAAPPGFAAAYAANVVSKEDDVSAVRTKVELGEGDAAIVYATDAAASDAVATIDVPDTLDVRATYAGVVIEGARQGAARAFLDWLAGPSGGAILGAHGFLPPP